MASPPSPFRRKQLGIALGMASGLALTLLALTRSAPGAPPDPASRLTAWATCDLVVGFWLAAAIVRMAAFRFFSADDVDAALAPGSPRARSLQAQLTNTLEQAVLAVIAYGAWLLAPGFHDPSPTAFAAAGCFSAGRLLFFAGYGRGAAHRALGFALTFYPTLGLLLARAAGMVLAWTHGLG